MTIPYADDQSLQRWGKNLTAAEEAANEVREAYAKAEAAKNAYNTAFGKATAQGETDLPASPKLIADMQALHKRAQEASTAEGWRHIANDAATLHPTYEREHALDQDRLDMPRKNSAAERRADLTQAEQDN
jgi:hypothetical protein